MNLQTKADFTALMHKFLDPLKPCYSAGCAAVVPLSAVPFSRADMSNIGSVAPSPVINVGSSPFQFSA